jgi:hypothetical protein
VFNKRTKFTFEKYPFLKQLDLMEMNMGVYSNGKWTGYGKSLTSVNPATNEEIGSVTTVKYLKN